MSNSQPLSVLIYGATGSQAGPVVWQLLDKGHQPHILTRNLSKAVAMQAAGATVVTGDMADIDSLRAASKGIDSVALMIPAFIANPADTLQYARNAITAAQENNIKLIVWNTSGPVLAQRIGHPMYDSRIDIADELRSSGVPFIVIQPTAYLENLLGPWTQPGVSLRDTLSYPVEEHVLLGWVATQDVAALMVAALEHRELAGSHFIASGVENVTGPELASRFSQALGREIQYRAMPLEEFGAVLDAAFGPGAGAGGIAGYQFQRDNAQLFTMWADMQPVLQQLPVTMTPITAWVAQHHDAFSQAKER